MGFASQYELDEVYQNGDIELRVYSADGDDVASRWMIKAGVGVVEFDRFQFEQLLELLISYAEEAYEGEGYE